MSRTASKFPKSAFKVANIARRKGGNVRYFDPETGAMSGWVSLSPGPNYSRMKKSELQELARVRGIKFTSKTTNAALVAALGKGARDGA